MHSIENDLVRVSFQPRGAELTSIYHKQIRIEYLWSGDPAYWAKHSPVLFPVVGGLKENTYFYNNQGYQLPRHGFAREKDFSVIEQTKGSITFSLTDDEETLRVYPFQFELRITYSISESELTVAYHVTNRSGDDMYFSIGGHPAFRIPLIDGTAYEDYFLEFNQPETANRWPVSPDGLIEDTPVRFFQNQSRINLKKELFLQDALVFKHLDSDSVSLKCTKHPHGLEFSYRGFPYMGIWAAKNADFMCIEPWCGIADSVTADQQLKHKEGIHKLETGSHFHRAWQIRLF